MIVSRFDHSLMVLAALIGALAVMSGAFGAHALKDVLDARWMQVYRTAVDYQFYHALVLVMLGLLLRMSNISTSARAKFRIAATLFLFGIVLFCGSLYALSLSGLHWLGMITPIGGLALIIAWLYLALGASKH